MSLFQEVFSMKKPFGILPSGEQAWLYTISNGKMEAHITDFGATLVRLYVPDAFGNRDDVVLGFDDCNVYRTSSTYCGAIIGRNANRVRDALFVLNGKAVHLEANENGNCNHSGPNCYAFRLWKVTQLTESSITLYLFSPDGDQGFPGNAEIRVTYALTGNGTLSVVFDATADKDTVFNMTNHSFFNLAGHQYPELAAQQVLILPSRIYTEVDRQNVPTGKLLPVDGTPMDFREAKPICRDIAQPHTALRSGGYDLNFEVFTDPAAILHDPVSGRTMSISTDLPGLHFYSGNYLAGEIGKDGIPYCRRSGMALETQYYPDSVNHPEWKQPFTKAGERWHSETRFTFK